jgi:hypothetical protein
VVMFLGATKQKKLDGVWFDAALLHPTRSMLGQSFQSIPLLLSETATLRRVVAQIASHYKNLIRNHFVSSSFRGLLPVITSLPWPIAQWVYSRECYP